MVLLATLASKVVGVGNCSGRDVDKFKRLLLEDNDSMVQGNDWARGFMHGTGLRRDGWAELVNDEEHGG